MDTLEQAVAAHKATHAATGKQSKALRTGFTRVKTDFGDRVVVGPDGAECAHESQRVHEWHDDVLLCPFCFDDGT